MIFLGADHAGFKLKQEIILHLEARGVEYADLGTTHGEQSCDYPDYALAVARKVSSTKEKGILVCGTGIGMSIAANKVEGIRAALVRDAESAKASREHNDSNILCLAARLTDSKTAIKIVDAWLDTPFSGEERHARRIKKISEAE